MYTLSKFVIVTVSSPSKSVKIKEHVRDVHYDYILGIGTYPSVLLGAIEKSSGIRIGCEHSSFDHCNIVWKIMRRITYPRLDCVASLTEIDASKMASYNKCVV